MPTPPVIRLSGHEVLVEPGHGRHLGLAVDGMRYRLHSVMAKALESQLSMVPPTLSALLERLRTLTGKLMEGDATRVSLSLHEAGLLKMSLLDHKRILAIAAEQSLSVTVDAATATAIEARASAVDPYVQASWFDVVPAASMPRYTDFLTLSSAYRALERSVALAGDSHAPTALSSQYDEKFGILFAPSGFLPDLAHFRRECALRSCPVSIAFVDVDEFKPLNSKYTETVVDRHILPRIMFAIEAHVFSHGRAYRQGGDEYLLLLPNSDRSAAELTLRGLQTRLAAVDFGRGIEATIRASIGLVTVAPDCALTDRQLVQATNRAEAFAKKSGKNRVCTYADVRLRDEDLLVAAEGPRTVAPAAPAE